MIGICVCMILITTCFSVMVTGKDSCVEVLYENNAEYDDFIKLTKPVYVWVEFYDNVTNICEDFEFDVVQYLAKPPDSDKRPNQIVHSIQFTSEHIILQDSWGQEVARWATTLANNGDKSSRKFLFKGIIYTINYDINPDNVTEDFPPDLDPRYFQDAEKYDIYSDTIQNAAQDAIGSETHLYWKVRKINEYVQDHLWYYNDGVYWNNATITLNNGYGTCSEYSWLFIALCRAVGIPARYVGSTWYKLGEPTPYLDQSFHRWPQVYFPPYGWVPVDPTLPDENGTHDYHENFGMMENWLLVTQICGGPSRYLGWNYNSNREYDPYPGDCRTWGRGGIWKIYLPYYPLKPIGPFGKINGKVGESYKYTTSTYDYFNDTIWYWWDWGDGTNSGWIGPYNSNDTCEASHSWKSEGKYDIKVKAKNRAGWESYWSDPLTVTMPRYKIFANFLVQRFFERFPL